jgi:hypothetical protein
MEAGFLGQLTYLCFQNRFGYVRRLWVEANYFRGGVNNQSRGNLKVRYSRTWVLTSWAITYLFNMLRVPGPTDFGWVYNISCVIAYVSKSWYQEECAIFIGSIPYNYKVYPGQEPYPIACLYLCYENICPPHMLIRRFYCTSYRRYTPGPTHSAR